eukprot:scaffold1467_cov135-Skeletonema_marinoi.AAC.1
MKPHHQPPLTPHAISSTSHQSINNSTPSLHANIPSSNVLVAPHPIETMPIQHSKYFDEKVQSLASERHGAKFSIGIISAGTYHFGTGAAERMTVVSGMLTAKLDGSDKWVNYPAGTNFEIPANNGFDVKASTDTAYQCQYL